MVRDPTLAQTLTRLPRRWYHGDSIVDRGEGVLRFVWLVFGTLAPAVVAIVPSPEGAQGIDLLLTAIHNATAVVGYGTLVFMELAQVRLARPNCCPCLAPARALARALAPIATLNAAPSRRERLPPSAVRHPAALLLLRRQEGLPAASIQGHCPGGGRRRRDGPRLLAAQLGPVAPWCHHDR